MKKLLVMVMVAMLCLAFMVSFAAAAVETGGLVTTGTALSAVGSVAVMVWLIYYARAADADLKSAATVGDRSEFINEAGIAARAAASMDDLPKGYGLARVDLDDRAGGDGALGAWPEPAVA